jgi:hypothetical protein
VGKGQRPEPRKPDNKSNTLSSEVHSSEEVGLQPPKQVALPTLLLASHRPALRPMPASFRPPRHHSFHREYRYQELF